MQKKEKLRKTGPNTEMDKAAEPFGSAALSLRLAQKKTGAMKGPGGEDETG